MKLNGVKLIVLEQLEYSGSCSEKHLKLCETIKQDVLRLLEKERLITRCSGLVSITQKGLDVFSFFNRIKKG